MGKKAKTPKANRDTVAAETPWDIQNRFKQRLEEAGVTQELRIFIEDYVRCEQAKAVEQAAKTYVSDAEHYPVNNEFPVGDMLEILARRANGLYAAVTALGHEVGHDNFIYVGVAQIAFDVSRFAQRVNDGYAATQTVKWGKRQEII